jgi:hypothetical protein
VFINFLSEEGAERFRATWHGCIPAGTQQIPADAWKQPLHIQNSDNQGFHKNFLSFVRVDLARLSPHLWPIVFQNGRRQDFGELSQKVQQEQQQGHRDAV